jgi:Flp pilus assembly pilin Flp
MFRKLGRDRGGNAAVEFAFLAPALLLFLIGTFEFAIMLFVGSSLEGAVMAASRYGITGFADGETTREARIREIIRERTHGMVDMDDVQIRTLVYPSFGQVGQPEPFEDDDGDGEHDDGEDFDDVNGNGAWDDDMGREGLGGPGEIVLYEVEYQTEGLTTLLKPILGEITHRSAVAVRNEPF